MVAPEADSGASSWSLRVTVVWIDGKYHDRDTAVVSVFDHGLLYGDGVFEGIRAYGGRLFRPEHHLDRLDAPANALCLDGPPPPPALAPVVRAGRRPSPLHETYPPTL